MAKQDMLPFTDPYADGVDRYNEGEPWLGMGALVMRGGWSTNTDSKSGLSARLEALRHLRLGWRDAALEERELLAENARKVEVRKKYSPPEQRPTPRIAMSKTHLNVLLDMDDVIVAFAEGMRARIALARSPDLPEPPLGPPGPERFGAFTPEEWDLADYGFWASLRWTKYGRAIVAILEAEVGRDAITLCTSPCSTSGCLQGKMDWIKEHLPLYTRQVVFTPRKYLLANPAHLLIDDYDKNIQEFRSHGGQTYLVPAHHNKAFLQVPQWTPEHLRLVVRRLR